MLGNRCAAALMLKRYASARQDATLILQHDKENVRACTRLAKACLGCGDIASAVAWAQEAAQREPGSAQVRTELAKMQRAQAELQSAEASLARGDGAAAAASARRVHALFPDMTIEVAEIVLVQALLQQNQGAEALKASRDVLAANSSSSAARTVHAQALIATGAPATHCRVRACPFAAICTQACGEQLAAICPNEASALPVSRALAACRQHTSRTHAVPADDAKRS